MEDQTVGISRLSHSDAGRICKLMTSAFITYPPMKYVLDGAEIFENGVFSIQKFYLDIFLEHGWPVIGGLQHDTLKAVALLVPPNAEESNDIKARLLDALKSSIGDEAFVRLTYYEDVSASLAPDSVHYYLGILAVEPLYQGIGLGRKMLSYISKLSEDDVASSGICLNTEAPDNVKIYEKQGYRVIASKSIADFTTWCMFKTT